MGNKKSSKKHEAQRFKIIFENSPIAIWEEDLSALSDLRRDMRKRTVTNIHKYLAEHTDIVVRTFRKIRICHVNKAALELYGVKSRQELVAKIGKSFTKEILNILIEEFSTLLEGKLTFESEFKNKTNKGRIHDILIKVSVPPEYKDSFERVIVTLQDITERKKLERHLRKLAQLDSLTKLYNHNTINQRLDAEFIRARRYGSSLSCMMIDVDHFKVINDEHGHQKGDRIIKNVASTLKNTVRQVDIVGRYGGDEFFVLLPETKPQNAKLAAMRIQNVFDNKKFLIKKGQSVQIALSIGISGFPAKGTKEPKDLIAKADKAMYAAKKSGRNRIIIA